MEIILMALNGLVAFIGVVVVAVGFKADRRWKTITMVGIGTWLTLVAMFGLPSRVLKHLKYEMVESETEPADDDSVLGGDSGADLATESQTDNQVVIVGDCDALVDLLTARPWQDDAIVAWDDDDSAVTAEEATPSHRDPVAPAVITPQRESTLPEEPQTGEPKCSSPTLLHGPSGGPGQGGCHAVGCAEGYALPMKLLPDRWVACPEPKRFARFNDCYYFYDSDGSERSARFDNGQWKPCE